MGGTAIPAHAGPQAVTVAGAPPAPRVEAVPAPRRGWAWVPGYWGWNGHRHAWVRGSWVHERRGYVYLRPQWVERNGHWELRRGAWVRGAVIVTGCRTAPIATPTSTATAVICPVPPSGFPAIRAAEGAF